MDIESSREDPKECLVWWGWGAVVCDGGSEEINEKHLKRERKNIVGRKL